MVKALMLFSILFTYGQGGGPAKLDRKIDSVIANLGIPSPYYYSEDGFGQAEQDLVKIGKPAIPKLVTALRGESPWTRVRS
jgi:hypothetical protein